MGIKKALGNDCKIEFKIISDIPPLKNGKFRYTISEI